MINSLKKTKMSWLSYRCSVVLPASKAKFLVRDKKTETVTENENFLQVENSFTRDRSNLNTFTFH